MERDRVEREWIEGTERRKESVGMGGEGQRGTGVMGRDKKRQGRNIELQRETGRNRRDRKKEELGKGQVRTEREGKLTEKTVWGSKG